MPDLLGGSWLDCLGKEEAVRLESLDGKRYWTFPADWLMNPHYHGQGQFRRLGAAQSQKLMPHILAMSS